MRILDLYAGAGGLTLGFKRAFEGIDDLRFTPVDNDPFAFGTHSLNFGAHGIDKPIDVKDFMPGAGDIFDLVIGGPPCQPFSNANTRKRKNDPRLDEWRRFMRAVDLCRPRAFVVENVPALHSSPVYESLIEAGERLGYVVAGRALCAADFGAATTRTRLFIVGFRRDKARMPAWAAPMPTHRATTSEALLFETRRWVTLRDVIEGLPEPVDRHGCAAFRGHRYTDSKRDRLRASLVPVGVNALAWLRKNRPELISPTYRTRDPQFFPRAYQPLGWDKPAKTITTQFFDHAKGQLHPGGKRALTRFEAARIQGFPDDFAFVGSKEHAARQIGNAVPVPLAQAVAASVKEQMPA